MSGHYVFISFFLIILVCLRPLYGKDTDFYSIHDEYVGIRPLGMGNAFTAVGGDYNTLFYNPSGLAKLEESRLNISLMRFGLTTGESSFVDLYGDIKDFSSNPDKETSTTEMANYIASKYGKSYYARLTPLSTFWAAPRKAFAFIPIDFSLRMSIHQQVGPAIKVRAFQDTTVAFGYGKELPSIPNLAVGVTAKMMYRAYFGRLIPALELVSNSKFIGFADAKEGQTIDFDAGMLYTFNFGKNFKPALGMNLKNIWDVGFRDNYHLFSKDSNPPPDLERRLDVGAMIPFEDVWEFSPKMSIDIRNIGHYNWSFMKGLHVGTEWEWVYDYWLKGSLLAGLKQGYPTYGVSMQGLWFLMEFVSYGDEIGTKNLRHHNRVYMGKLSFYF